MTKDKKNKTATLGTMEKSQKQRQIHTSTTYMYDRSLFWLGTSTSMKSGGVKLVILHAYIFHSKHQTVIQLINI
jgi:hypothetical protein